MYLYSFITYVFARKIYCHHHQCHLQLAKGGKGAKFVRVVQLMIVVHACFAVINLSLVVLEQKRNAVFKELVNNSQVVINNYNCIYAMKIYIIVIIITDYAQNDVKDDDKKKKRHHTLVSVDAWQHACTY